ncbi:MAG: right-handed parallel beta-helix repeat-containing protein, partial [Candidatus Competibacteraceae bacterium]|nr:right-handed parallel beta-helix repeat-containing protein [Candidatus Competibacteraceae bacterium]
MSIHSIRRPRASLGWCAGTVSLFLILALNFSVVQADTFTVTTLSNSGPGSLRQAILDANADLTTSHTITFQSGLTGTITLTDGKIAIIGRMTITGPGASVLAVSGNNASQVFDVSSLSATISGLTIKEGKSSYGGGINNNGYLTLNQVTVSDNTATNSGGGISSGGYLTLNQVTVSNNASDSGNGGGISLGGTATITNTVIDSNQTGGSYGGGIYAGSTLTITNSTLSNNGSFGCGGGIYINSGSKTVNITNSTLSGNVAHTNGGGICNSSGNVTVTNSTLTANLAIQYGGGISGFTSGFTLHNSIVAGNTALNGPEIVGNSDAESASSLFGENGVSGVQGLTPPATEVIAGPLSSVIGPLADNGGPTQTHALVAGSPAINAGDNSLIPAGITTDQRGDGFPRIVGGTVDIGAIEGTSGGGANTYTLTVGTSGGNGIVISTPTGINCGATCTAPFNSGLTVTLIATPLDSTVSFTGWSGDCNNLTGPCVVTMDSAKSVTALFSNASPTAYSLTLAKAGAGSGTVSGAGSYAAGATVNLTATPSSGSTFTGWSPSPCAASFTMPAHNLACTATFTSGPTGGSYALNVALSGVGVGSVTSQPSGIACSNIPGDDADCS